MGSFNLTLSDVYRLMLVMFRTGSFLMTVPVFGHMTIPRALKIYLIVLFSFIIFPTTLALRASSLAPPATLAHLVLAVLNEIFIGLLMGFAVIIVFSAVQYAGQLVGMQMGLAIANVWDPMGAGEISLIGEFYYLLSLLLFLTINGHYYVINALIRCFTLVPVSGGAFHASLGEYLVTLTGMIFVVAIKLSAPVIITLYILNVILGIVARTVPQMNVFIVGFPLAIGVGFALIAFTLPVFKIILEKVFLEIQPHLYTIFQILRS